jgi:hypothetical protein
MEDVECSSHSKIYEQDGLKFKLDIHWTLQHQVEGEFPLAGMVKILYKTSWQALQFLMKTTTLVSGLLQLTRCSQG